VFVFVVQPMATGAGRTYKEVLVANLMDIGGEEWPATFGRRKITTRYVKKVSRQQSLGTMGVGVSVRSHDGMGVCAVS
jgi:hypothetical protein